MQGIDKAYQMDAAAVLAAVGSAADGLAAPEAARRLQANGANELSRAERASFFRRLGGQLSDPMVLVLLAAAVLSALLNEWTDSLIIIAVVLLNAVLGLVQEGKAAKAAEALAAMAAPQAVVRRAGQLQRIPAREVVVGDVLVVAAGDVCPADLRLLQAVAVQADESSLTGESLAVEKQAEALPAAEGREVALAERSCMLFMGTPVLRGHGEGLVVATGDDTEMGRIAGLLSTGKQQQTPLQKRLAELSKVLSLAVLIISALVFGLTFSAAQKAFWIPFCWRYRWRWRPSPRAWWWW